MIAWLAANWLSLVVGLIVIALVVLSLRNILPGKHQASCGGSCAGCAGCGGSCAGCSAGCGARPKTKS